MIKKLVDVFCCVVLLAGTATSAQEPAISANIPTAKLNDAGFTGRVNMEHAGGLRDFHYQDPAVFMRVILPAPSPAFDLSRLKAYSLAGTCDHNNVTLRASLELDRPESAVALQKAVESAAAEILATKESAKPIMEQWARTVKVNVTGTTAFVDMAVSKEFLRHAGKVPRHISFWLVVGFVGQALFAGRFVVQWIASEKEKKSVIPIYFWFFSIGGGMILLTYAISIKDPVFILGQSTGLFIYVRNLMLLSREKKQAPAPA